MKSGPAVPLLLTEVWVLRQLTFEYGMFWGSAAGTCAYFSSKQDQDMIGFDSKVNICVTVFWASMRGRDVLGPNSLVAWESGIRCAVAALQRLSEILRT